MIVFSYERNIEQFVIEYITNFLYHTRLLGVEGATVYRDQPLPDSATAVIYVQKLPDELPAGLKIYLLNIEQLSITYWYNTIRGYIDRGVQVIDYSWKNVETLNRDYAGRIHYIPYLYNPRELIVPGSGETLAYFGWMSPRREAVSAALKAAGIAVDAFNGIYGAERDARLAVSRSILNVHYRDDYRILETIRISRLLFSGFLVISEASEQECNPLIDACVESAHNLICLPYERLLEPDRVRGCLGHVVGPVPHEKLAANSAEIIRAWLTGGANSRCISSDDIRLSESVKGLRATH
jgi:hypothetical protein